MCVPIGYTGRIDKRPVRRFVPLLIFVLCLGAGRTVSGADTGRDWAPVKDAFTHMLLRERADSSDPLERLEAVQALCQIADPADLPVLDRLLADPDGRVRAETVSGLAAWEPASLLPVAEELIRDVDPAVRYAMWVAAPVIPGWVESGWVEVGLADADVAVRAAAVTAAPMPGSVSALRKMRDEDPSMHVRVAAWSRWVSGADADLRSEALAWAFAQPGTEFSARAAHALMSDDRPFFAAVVERLATPRSPDLRAMIQAVGRAGIAEAVPLLLERMDVYDPLSRKAACRALTAFDLPGVVDALARRISLDSDLEVVRAATEALAKHPSAEAVPGLANALETDRPRAREWVAHALGVRRDPAGIPALLGCVADPSPAVRTAAWVALRRIDPEAAVAVLDDVRASLRSDHVGESVAAAHLLGAMGDRSDIPFMKDRLAIIEPAHPWQLREAILEALVEIGYDALLDRALELAAHEVLPPPPGEVEGFHDNDEVRIAALRYLARFGDALQADSVRAAFETVPPFSVRQVLSELMTEWTGVTYVPVRTRVYSTYSVESLDPPPVAEWEPAGIRRVE